MAIGLIITGTILLVGNLIKPELLVNAWKLWPLLLVGLGLEFLIRDAQCKKAKEPVELRFSWASVLIIGLIVVSGFTAHVIYKIAGAVNVEQFLKEEVFGNVANYTRTFEKDPVPISKDAKIVLQNSTGDIRVKQSNDDKLYIKGEIAAGGSGQREAKEKAEGVNVVVEGTKDIVIKADLPKYNGSDNVAINYEVFIPKDIIIEINNKVGKIFAEEISGGIKINNEVGRITLLDIVGDGEISSEEGQIDVDGMTGNLKTNSNTGSIQVSNPGGDVEAKTRIGSIELSSAKALAGKYELNAQNGSINIIIPQESDLKLVAISDHGKVSGPKSMTSDLKGRNVSKLEGILGAGKGNLNASSRIGSIDIKLK